MRGARRVLCSAGVSTPGARKCNFDSHARTFRSRQTRSERMLERRVCERCTGSYNTGLSIQKSSNAPLIRMQTRRSRHTCRVFDTEDGHCQGVLRAHKDVVHCVETDASTVVSASRDGSVRVWDIGTGIMDLRLAHIVFGGFCHAFEVICLMADDSLLRIVH